MLNLRMRDPKELEFINVDALPCDMGDGHKTRTLYYRSIMEAGDSAKQPMNVGELSVFPPESTYHCSTHSAFAADAYNSFVRQHGHMILPGRNCYATALRMWSASVQASSVAFVPNLLTHSVVTSVMELPCITYADGFIFTIKIDTMTNTVRIRPTQVTGMPTDTFTHTHVGHCSSLPMTGERSFGFRDMGTVMAAGLRMDDDGMIRLRLPNDVPLKDTAIVYPFMLLPVVKWRAAVVLQIVGETVPTPEGALRVVNLEEHFTRLSRYELAGDELAAWHTENADLPVIAPGISLHVICLAAGTYYWLRQTLCSSSNTSHLFFYSSVTQLKYELAANDGFPDSFEMRFRVHWDEMLTGSTVFSPFEHDSCCLFPILKDEATDELFIRRYTFDSRSYDAQSDKCAKLKERYDAVVARNATLQAAVCKARMESTKADISWDVAYTSAHETHTKFAPMVAVRAAEYEAAKAAFAGASVDETFQDMCLGKTLERSIHALPRTKKLPGALVVGIMRPNPCTGTYINAGRYCLLSLFHIVFLSLHSLSLVADETICTGITSTTSRRMAWSATPALISCRRRRRCCEKASACTSQWA